MVNENTIIAASSYIMSQFKKQQKSKPVFETRLPKPFVTISREAGAGGTTVGEMLVNYLNHKFPDSPDKWTLFDKNLIAKVIEEHNLPEEFIHYLPEEKISELQSAFEQLMGLHPGLSKLAAKTCSTIINLAALGNVVIIGRGANILTRNFDAGFHVRLVADMEFKIKYLQEVTGLTHTAAVKFIKEEDTRRKEYVKKLFNKNVADPMGYDLVIKTSSISLEETAELIAGHVIAKKIAAAFG